MNKNKVLQPLSSRNSNLFKELNLTHSSNGKSDSSWTELILNWIKDHEEVRATDSFLTDKEAIRDLSVPHKFESKLKKSCWEGREQGTGQWAEGDVSVNEYLVGRMQTGVRGAWGRQEAGKPSPGITTVERAGKDVPV